MNDCSCSGRLHVNYSVRYVCSACLFASQVLGDRCPSCKKLRTEVV